MTYLDVAAGGDQKTVVFGEVQVAQPASVERVHAVFTLAGADLQQGAVLGAPELQNIARAIRDVMKISQISWQPDRSNLTFDVCLIHLANLQTCSTFQFQNYIWPASTDSQGQSLASDVEEFQHHHDAIRVHNFNTRPDLNRLKMTETRWGGGETVIDPQAD